MPCVPNGAPWKGRFEPISFFGEPSDLKWRSQDYELSAARYTDVSYRSAVYFRSTPDSRMEHLSDRAASLSSLLMFYVRELTIRSGSRKQIELLRLLRTARPGSRPEYGHFRGGSPEQDSSAEKVGFSRSSGWFATLHPNRSLLPRTRLANAGGASVGLPW
jgi:hypothetical protein